MFCTKEHRVVDEGVKVEAQYAKTIDVLHGTDSLTEGFDSRIDECGKTSLEVTGNKHVSTEDVYDITVDGEHHTYWSGGCNVSNCSEIALEDWGVCLLGSLVLPHFIINKNTDWKKLSRTIKLAVRFLDNVIDLAYYPIPIQEIVAKNARRIGLGTMGLSDFLFMKEIRYGSEKAIAEVEKLYRFIRDETYMASMELAKEKGTFPKYNKKDFNNASFVKKLPAKIRILIKENGIRNTTMLTAPPTGSSSLLVDVVGGIEPLPFKGFRRVDGLGERIYVHPLCKEHYDEEWFVDSYDLTPTEHLEMQSVVNRYVDSGVSKTILLPESATVDELSKLLLEYIRDLKGVAVYRDKSRDLQVYYRMERDAIEKYLLENGETALTDEDMQCKTGTCDI